MYGPPYLQGDVIGVGYRPRTGTIFFTRNGKKLEDVAHGLKSQNFFPTVGANGPCTVHVNFGQMGFVFIEANVKKWGLAPMTGSLAPPPPYGSEQGSILLETGREGAQVGGRVNDHGHSRTRSGIARIGFPTSPGPPRSPTDISLAQLAHVRSHEDIGEGTSTVPSTEVQGTTSSTEAGGQTAPPPEYSSPDSSRRSSGGSEAPLVLTDPANPPIPSYDAAIGNEHPSEERGEDNR